MTERIYTLSEFYAERPMGELYIRDDMEMVWKVFQCHGCQSCWEYIEDPGGDFDKDRVDQIFPHFYSMEKVAQEQNETD